MIKTGELPGAVLRGKEHWKVYQLSQTDKCHLPLRFDAHPETKAIAPILKISVVERFSGAKLKLADVPMITLL